MGERPLNLCAGARTTANALRYDRLPQSLLRQRLFLLSQRAGRKGMSLELRPMRSRNPCCNSRGRSGTIFVRTKAIQPWSRHGAVLSRGTAASAPSSTAKAGLWSGVQRHGGRPIARRISQKVYRDEVELTATAISGRSRPKLNTSYASCPHKTLPISGAHPFGRLELPIRRATPAWAEPSRF